MDKILRELAKQLTQTRVTGLIPGGQLLAQTKMSPTVEDIAKTLIYNPETKKAFPMSPLHKVMEAKTGNEMMSASLPFFMGMTGTSGSGNIMKAQSAKDIARQQGDDLLLAIEKHLDDIANPSKNPTAVDDFGDLTNIKQNLIKGLNQDEDIRLGMEILHRNKKPIGIQQPEIVQHYTYPDVARKIAREGFNPTSKRPTTYFTGESEIGKTYGNAKISADISGLKLMEVSNSVDDPMRQAMMTGDTSKLPKGYDGFIQRTPEGKIQEVALRNEIATSRMIKNKSEVRDIMGKWLPIDDYFNQNLPPKMNLDQIQAATEGVQKPLLYQFSKATDNTTKKAIIDQMIKTGGYDDYVPVLQRSIK